MIIYSCIVMSCVSYTVQDSGWSNCDTFVVDLFIVILYRPVYCCPLSTYLSLSIIDLFIVVHYRPIYCCPLLTYLLFSIIDLFIVVHCRPIYCCPFMTYLSLSIIDLFIVVHYWPIYCCPLSTNLLLSIIDLFIVVDRFRDYQVFLRPISCPTFSPVELIASSSMTFSTVGIIFLVFVKSAWICLRKSEKVLNGQSIDSAFPILFFPWPGYFYASPSWLTQICIAFSAFR